MPATGIGSHQGCQEPVTNNACARQHNRMVPCSDPSIFPMASMQQQHRCKSAPAAMKRKALPAWALG